jgi:hypothetical protein
VVLPVPGYAQFEFDVLHRSHCLQLIRHNIEYGKII